MRLSDVVGHSGLAGYAEVAMILFLVAFVAIALRTFLASRHEMERRARMPLDDDADGREGDQP
jgi:cbb3-type cytochrome oxidase subunit 3